MIGIIYFCIYSRFNPKEILQKLKKVQNSRDDTIKMTQCQRNNTTYSRETQILKLNSQGVDTFSKDSGHGKGEITFSKKPAT